jgi:excisionase family DNA binding protein
LTAFIICDFTIFATVTLTYWSYAMKTAGQAVTLIHDTRRAVLSTPEAADYLGLKKPTLDGWRSRGFGPKFIRQGRKVSYRQKELDEWLEAGLRSSTAGAGSNGDAAQ